MAAKVKPVVRQFKYAGVSLPDPNAAWTVDQVRDVLALQFPEISTASVSGPQAVAGKMVYTFDRAVGVKG
jgi:PRTRC genetic system protein C